MSEVRVPVLIVGGGPVGLVLAMELGSRGVRSLLVNERAQTTTHPKGSTLNCRTMEHLRRLGLGEQVRALGLPPDHVTDSIYVTALSRHQLGRIPMPTSREKTGNPGPWGQTALTPEPIHRCNQMYFESAFKTHADAYETTDLRFAWRLLSFEQGAVQVTAEVEAIKSGERATVICDHLVGCDGGNSLVRRGLGVSYGGRSSSGDRFYDGRMISAYFDAPGVLEVLGMPPAWHYWTINPAGRVDFITLDGTGRYLLLAEVDPQIPFDEIDVEGIFRTAVGTDVEARLVSVQEWVAGLALVADRFQDGRVFMAGDAVHLFTPSGGFGFNTGIDDAANLGWKLAAVSQGWGGQGLLDCYEAERRPIGIRNTTMSGRFAATIGDLHISPCIDEDSPAGEAARANFATKVPGFAEEFASLGVQLGARYDGSPIIVPDGTAPPPDAPASYTPTACPGGRAPHYWLPDGGSIFDRFGPWFTLLRLRPGAGGAERFVAAAAEMNVPLDLATIDDAGARDLYEADFVLVRPDQHVAWRADALPEDPAAVLAAVTGNSR